MMYTSQHSILLFVMYVLSFLVSTAVEGFFPSSGDALPEPKVWLVTRLSEMPVTTVRIAVQIPENHHGYLDTGDEGFYIPLALSFPTLEAVGVNIRLLSQPQGVRDETAHATVLRGYGEFSFRLEMPTTALQIDQPLPLLLHYQICNDVTKLCYPPQTLHLQLTSVQEVAPQPVVGVRQGGQSPAVAATPSLSERLYAAFKQAQSNLTLAFLLVAAAGLLASATPCVYPMLPITSAIFAARGQGVPGRNYGHAFIYCAGLIGFYALMGLLAATTGTALSAIMTHAWVYLGFTIIFIYLGLSMLGLYDLQFLPVLMGRLDTLSSHWKGFAGTLVMGATAGLVVSPCVGPITGTILLDIAGQSAQANAVALGLPPAWALLRGIFLMSGFGFGLSLPFLLLGLLGSRLPQSGPWLTKTKYILALPTLYFAYWYYIKGMEIAAVPLPIAQAMLIGILAIGGAVFLGCLQPLGDKPSATLRLRRAVSLMLLIVGIHFFYNGLGQSGLLLRPSTSIPVPFAAQTDAQQAAVEMHANLRWLREFASAQEQARRDRKPLFVDFYASWCANCKAFQKLTESDPQLNAALQQVILAKIYDTDPIFRTFQQEPHYPELRGINGQPLLPLFAIYSAHGVLLWKGQDYQAVSTIVAQLEYARGL